jgi:hypothetical protein
MLSRRVPKEKLGLTARRKIPSPGEGRGIEALWAVGRACKPPVVTKGQLWKKQRMLRFLPAPCPAPGREDSG